MTNEQSPSAHTPAPIYSVSTCPDTNKQFLVSEGKDGNIIELTKDNIKKIAAAPITKENHDEMLAMLETLNAWSKTPENEFPKGLEELIAKARGACQICHKEKEMHDENICKQCVADLPF